MSQPSNSLPKWILIVSALIALMEILVSFFLVTSPGSSTNMMVDIAAKGVDYLIYMWAVRQFALGIIFAYATIKRSVPMLTLAYIFFLVMFIGDFAIGIWQKNNGLIGAAVFMCALSTAMLYFINKRK